MPFKRFRPFIGFIASLFLTLIFSEKAEAITINLQEKDKTFVLFGLGLSVFVFVLLSLLGLETTKQEMIIRAVLSLIIGFSCSYIYLSILN